jgi:hypothetical protein
MNMANSEFVFVGYLVQERYVRNWWKREGKRLASLENTAHPSFEKPQWQSVPKALQVALFRRHASHKGITFYPTA